MLYFSRKVLYFNKILIKVLYFQIRSIHARKVLVFQILFSYRGLWLICLDWLRQVRATLVTDAYFEVSWKPCVCNESKSIYFENRLVCQVKGIISKLVIWYLSSPCNQPLQWSYTPVFYSKYELLFFSSVHHCSVQRRVIVSLGQFIPHTLGNIMDQVEKVFHENWK